MFGVEIKREIASGKCNHNQPHSPSQDSTQQTMLMAWLVELFLNDLGTLKDEGDIRGHHTMQQDFHKFLESPALRVRKDVV